VHAAELRDRVVAVLVEDPGVETFGALDADRRRRGGACRRDLIEKLVEKQPAQRLRRARVAREQRALDRLGQVDEREHRLIEVGEVRRKRGRLRCRERLSQRAHSSSSLAQ
jgi:hypothetical protein